MFDDLNKPKYSPTNLYPIDIHSCAEAILCGICIQENETDKDRLIDMAKWVIEKMEYSDGLYAHRIEKRFGCVELTSKIPLLRWGQGWMFLALTELSLMIKKDEVIER